MAMIAPSVSITLALAPSSCHYCYSFNTKAYAHVTATELGSAVTTHVPMRNPFVTMQCTMMSMHTSHAKAELLTTTSNNIFVATET